MMEVKTCFLVCPIGEENSETRKRSDKLMKYIIQPVCQEKGYVVERADLIHSNDKIYDTIINFLENSELVIADVTDNNPNVFYELGYRTAKSLPVIQIAQKGHALPFDIGNIRAQFYELDLEKVDKFKEQLSQIIENIEETEKIKKAELANQKANEVFTPDFQRTMIAALFNEFIKDPKKFKDLTNKD